jgi:hypothetical protein
MGIKGQLNVKEYVYDFAVDGGSTGTVNLHAKNGASVVPIGAVIQRVTAYIETAVTSAGSATVAWGNGDDADGFSGSAIAKASLTANAVFNGWDNAAALLWDDTNDHQIYQYVADAADGQMIVTIGTADLTAGKIRIVVEYLMPGVDN